jgi:light-regulated signal transduction histidine kinase (bacteriophytochrome)
VFDDSGNAIDALTILANEAAVRFSGLPKELYLTKPATYFDPNIISSPYGQSCISTLKTGKPFIMQYFLEYSSRWLELTVSKMNDSHLIHIFTDVTDIKEAQLKLERSLEELRYSNANLEEFAYAASHDLKEPVRKIQFFSNRLRNELADKLDANQADMFGRLEKSSKRMDSLINDLLEYSQAAKGSSEKEEIDLNERMKYVLEDLELEVQRRKANVTFGKLPSIIGNRRQIQQLFQNLIGNALKYSKPGVAPEITIKSVSVRGRDTKLNLPKELLDVSFHLISVSDNGIGFEQGDADRIFKVFTRLHNHPESRGSGIGLSIVRKVVEGHNGYIWAESQPGTGSTFNMLFPAHG